MLGISGKYRVETRLGGGGMAEVFLGSMVLIAVLFNNFVRRKATEAK